MEKATNSKGNSEAKRKAKGRKPDAWRSRRGRRAGDPTAKPSAHLVTPRPARSAGWPRPGHAEAARGWEHGGAAGGAGEQSGGSGADAAMGGGECVRSTVQVREAPPLPVAAPAPRGGPRRRAWQPRRPFGTSQLGEGREGHHDTCGRANRPHGDPSPVFVKCPGTIHTCVSRHQDARLRPATRPAGKKPSPQNRDLRAGGNFPLCDRGAR